MTTDAPEWQWFCSHDEKMYDGPFSTREVAIAGLDDEPGWVCEGMQTPVRLSDFFDADLFFDGAEERAIVISDPDGDPLFDVTPDQESDLERRIKAAINEWQDAHGLRFIPCTFTDMRNKERIK